MLKDMLSEAICIDFHTHLNLSEAELKDIISKWPEQIYGIIIMMQREESLSHYVFRLPNGNGLLDFTLDKERKTMNIKYQELSKLTFEKKFSELLGDVYQDIQIENEIKESIKQTFSKNKQLHDKFQ